jgi:hypothetical protein
MYKISVGKLKKGYYLGVEEEEEEEEDKNSIDLGQMRSDGAIIWLRISEDFV